jgi:hypothetical protein
VNYRTSELKLNEPFDHLVHVESMNEGALQVCKNPLRRAVVTDVTAVDQAVSWAKRLTHSESRGPGDMENAWRRLEAKYGIPWRSFWSLRYRRPSEIAASIYLRLQAAYEAECERVLRRAQHELTLTKAKAGINHAVVAEAEALVGESDDEDTK